MTDDPRPPGVGGSPGDADPETAGPPIDELAGLSESPSPQFMARVLDGVARRQASGRFLEVLWWGWTSLLLEMFQVVFKALGIREEPERKD